MERIKCKRCGHSEAIFERKDDGESEYCPECERKYNVIFLENRLKRGRREILVIESYYEFI